MKTTIMSGQTPNLLMLHYDVETWTVRNLVVLPSFAFPPSCLVVRKALSANARRAGWVGCNIRLTGIPLDARIPIVTDGVAHPPAKVRHRFELLKPISGLGAAQRGWALDVLNVIRSLGAQTFTLREVLRHASDLARLHPENHHVEAKIRQQLQRLRDLGFLEFSDNRGSYRLRNPL